MILLVSPQTGVLRRSEVFSQALGQPVQSADNLEQACLLLRSQVFGAVVFDQGLIEFEHEKAEAIFQLLETAIPVYINFGVSSFERSIDLIRSAVVRRERDLRSARRQAQEELRNEVNDLITALLLSCELAMDNSGNEERGTERIQSIHGLALQIKANLSVPS
jgi:hypothetical protein